MYASCNHHRVLLEDGKHSWRLQRNINIVTTLDISICFGLRSLIWVHTSWTQCSVPSKNLLLLSRYISLATQRWTSVINLDKSRFVLWIGHLSLKSTTWTVQFMGSVRGELTYSFVFVSEVCIRVQGSLIWCDNSRSSHSRHRRC